MWRNFRTICITRYIGVVLGCLPATAPNTMAQTVTGYQKVGPPAQAPPVGRQVTGNKELTLTVVDNNGKSATATIAITGIKVWPPPGINAPRSCADFAALVPSLATFQNMKAQAIAAAINGNATIAKAYASFNPALKATTQQYNNAEDGILIGLGKGIGIKNIYTNCANLGKPLPAGVYEEIIIPSLPANLAAANKALVWSTLKNPPNGEKPVPGEGGDGFRIVRPGGTPNQMTGSFGRDPQGGIGVAMGNDNGAALPSVVEVGITEEYVAYFAPAAGMTAEEVLLGLEDLLLEHGIPVNFDPVNVILSIDIDEGKTFKWGSTDPGLEFDAAVLGLENYNIEHVSLQATCHDYTVIADTAGAGGTVFSSGALGYNIVITPTSGAPSTTISNSFFPVNSDADGNFSAADSEPFGPLLSGTYTLTGSIRLVTGLFTSQISLFPPISVACGQ